MVQTRGRPYSFALGLERRWLWVAKFCLPS